MIMDTYFCGTTLDENFTGVFPFFPHTPIIPFPPPIFLTALWKRGDAEKLDGIRSGQNALHGSRSQADFNFKWGKKGKTPVSEKFD